MIFTIYLIQGKFDTHFLYNHLSELAVCSERQRHSSPVIVWTNLCTKTMVQSLNLRIIYCSSCLKHKVFSFLMHLHFLVLRKQMQISNQEVSEENNYNPQLTKYKWSNKLTWVLQLERKLWRSKLFLYSGTNWSKNRLVGFPGQVQWATSYRITVDMFLPARQVLLIFPSKEWQMELFQENSLIHC